MPIDREQLLSDFYGKYDKSKLNDEHLSKVINTYQNESDEQLLTDLYGKYDKNKTNDEHFTKVIETYTVKKKENAGQSQELSGNDSETPSQLLQKSGEKAERQQSTAGNIIPSFNPNEHGLNASEKQLLNDRELALKRRGKEIESRNSTSFVQENIGLKARSGELQKDANRILVKQKDNNTIPSLRDENLLPSSKPKVEEVIPEPKKGSYAEFEQQQEDKRYAKGESDRLAIEEGQKDAELAKLSITDKAKSYANSFLQGGFGGLASTVNIAGTVYTKTKEAITGKKDWGSRADDEITRKTLNNFQQEYMPEANTLKGSLGSQVARGFGQMGAMAASATVTGGSAIIPSVSAFAETYDSESQEALKNGASESTANKVALGNAFASMGLEAIPVLRMLNRANKTTGGVTFKQIALELGKKGVKGGLEESGTEMAQQGVSNLIAQKTYDKKRELGSGIVESGSVGGIIGLTSNIALSALGVSLKNAKTPKEKAEIESQIAELEGLKNETIIKEQKQIDSKKAEILASLEPDGNGGVIMTPEAKAELDKLENARVQVQEPAQQSATITEGEKPNAATSKQQESDGKPTSTEANKGATIESAVIEIGGETFEGKNHAEAILKAQQAGKDISQVDRQGQGKFRLSDGTVINRGQALQAFGAYKAEQLIPQDEKAIQADRVYEKIKREQVGKEALDKIEARDVPFIINAPKSDIDALVETRTSPPKEDAPIVTPVQENVTTTSTQPVVAGGQEQVSTNGVPAVSNNVQETGTTNEASVPNGEKMSPSEKIAKGLSGLKEKIGKQEIVIPNKKKRVPAKHTRNERIKNIQRDSPNSLARGYFLDGGKVLWQSPDGGITKRGIKEELGYGEGEKRSLVGILSKKGLGIEALAHQLWENQPISDRYSTQDFREAIHSVLSENRKDWFDKQEKEVAQDYFSDEYIAENPEKFDAISNDLEEATKIIEEQGINKDNIDKLQILFNGFPYNEQDFENVKKKLYEGDNETGNAETGQASERSKQRSRREGGQETIKRRGIAESISSKIRSLRKSKTETERKKLEDEIISETGDYLLMHEGVIVGDDASFANRKSETFFNLIDSKKSVYLLDEDAKIAQSKSDYLKLADELETTTDNPLFTEEEIESIKNKAEAIRQGALNGIVMFDDVLNSDLNLLKSVARDLGFDGVKVTEIDGTESTVHLWNFEKLTLVGGSDITGKSKIALGISRLMNKLGVEKNLVPDEYTSVFDDILLIAEGLVQETGKAGVELIEELKKLLKKQGYGKVAKAIDSFSDDILDALPKKNEPTQEQNVQAGILDQSGAEDSDTKKGAKQVEKTITTKRGFKGTTNKDLQKAYEKHGLHRYVKNQKEALDKAGDFLKDVGFDNAMDNLRNATDMRLMNKTMLWGKLMIEANQMLLDVKTETERQEALQRRAEITEWGGEHGLNMGEGASAFNAVYKDFEENGLDFGTDKLVEDAIKLWEGENKKDGESVTIPNSLKEEFQALGEKIKAVNKELAEANERVAEKEAHIAILELQDAEQKATNEKTITAKKQAAKKKVNDGLSEMFGALASISGGKLSAVDSDEKIIRGARKAIEGFMEEASITFEEAFNKLKDAVKSKGYNTDKLDEIRQNLESESTQFDKKESLFGLGNKKLRELAMKVEMGKDITPEQQVKQYVELIKNEISETHEGITDREIRDEISGYGKIITQSKEDGQKELSKMKNLFRGVSQLEDIGNGEPPKKSGFQKEPTDTDIRLIFRRVREALKTLPLDPETKEGLLKTAEQSYLKRLTNRIEDLKKENTTRIRVKKEKNQPLNSKDIADAKDIIADLEKEHSEIFRDELENEKTQAKLKASKSALNKRIVDLEKKIANNDFSKKEKPKQPFDEEKRKLILKKEKLVEDFNIASAKYAREHRTAGKKRVDDAIEITMALQAMKTAFDLGLAGVQLIPLLSRSVLSDIAHLRLSGDKSRTITALGNAFKSFASTEYAQKKLDEIRVDPYFDKAKKSQLSLIGVSQEVNEFQNEVIDNFMEKAVEKITRSKKIAEILNNKAFTRFNTTLGNELRFGTFKKAAIAAEMLGYDIETNKKEFKDIAGTVNSFSGRAKMKGLTDNDIARIALFSPKNWASMIKTATPVGLYRFAKMKGDKTLPIEGGIVFNSPARREAARTLLAMTTAGVSITLLAAMKYNDDEDDDTWVNLIDSTRSDFMKVSTKLKDGSVITSDFFGGRLSIIIAQARFLAAWKGKEQTSLSGKKRTTTPIDVLAEHSGNKLSPLFGTVKTYLSDRYRKIKDEKGKEIGKEKIDPYTKKPVDHIERLFGTVSPMAPTDIYHIMKNDPELLEGMNTILVMGGLANVNEKVEGKDETTNPYLDIKKKGKSKD